MSESSRMEDGADYFEIYGEDCDGECHECSCEDCDEHPSKKQKCQTRNYK